MERIRTHSEPDHEQRHQSFEDAPQPYTSKRNPVRQVSFCGVESEAHQKGGIMN